MRQASVQEVLTGAEDIAKRKSLPLDKLDAMTEVKPLSGLMPLGAQILKGQVRGRVVVDVNQ